MENEQKEVKKKKRIRFFESHITKLLKSISPDINITRNAKQQLNKLFMNICEIITSKCEEMVYSSKRQTITIKNVLIAVSMMTKGNLKEELIKSARDAVSSYNTCQDKYLARQDKASIIFPPSICEKFLRRLSYSKLMVTKSSPISLASILECLCTKILNEGLKNISRQRITIRNIELGIRGDNDLDLFFNMNNLSFLGGGVVPFIHDLLTKKRKKKEQVMKKKKIRPGTLSLKDIKKFQKTSNCLICAKRPFERKVRTIIKSFSNIKISKDIFVPLQYYIEDYIVSLLRDSNTVALHSNRVKVTRDDIILINNLRRYEKINI